MNVQKKVLMNPAIAKQKALEKKNADNLTCIEYLKEWGSNTTIHAVPYIVQNKNLGWKMFWSLFFTTASVTCIVFILMSINDFYEYNTDTVTELIKEKQFEFPTITFCNLQICGFNDYDFGKYLEKYKSDEEQKFGSSQREIIENNLKKNPTKTSYFLAKEIFLRQHSDDDLNLVLNRNKTSIKSMLLSCSFGGEICNENDFEFVLMGEFHKCYKFNSGKYFNDSEHIQRKSEMRKKNNGLQLELYIGSEYECKNPLVTTSGLLLYVHNKSYVLTEDDNGILIEPGTHTEVLINPTYIKKLPDPYSTCIETVSLDHLKGEELNEAKKKIMDVFKDDQINRLIRETINYTNIYSQQYCLQLCYQEFLHQFCECNDLSVTKYLPEVNQTNCPKFIDSLYNCQYIIKKLFYNGRNDAKCFHKCPNECDYTLFDVSTSSSLFPTENYLEMIKELKKRKYLNDVKLDESTMRPEGMVSFDLHYPSSTITKVTEKPSMTLINLLSNLGGTLGLFLGMSVLSLSEVFEICCRVVHMWLKKMHNN